MDADIGRTWLLRVRDAIKLKVTLNRYNTGRKNVVIRDSMMQEEERQCVVRHGISECKHVSMYLVCCMKENLFQGVRIPSNIR